MPRRPAQSAHRIGETHRTRHNGEVGRNLHVGGIQVDRDRALGQAAARGGGSRPSIHRSQASFYLFHCPGVTRRARPAAVVEDSPGTGVSCWPATSARWRSSPTRNPTGQLRSRDPRQQSRH